MSSVASVLTEVRRALRYALAALLAWVKLEY